MAPISFFRASFEDGDESALFSNWSFIHFASGAVVGGVACLYINNSAASVEAMALVALILFQLWEVFEYIGYAGNASGAFFTYEHPLNRLSDVMVDLFGFLIIMWVSRIDVV